MISDVIYPRAKFVLVARHSSSTARLLLSRCKTRRIASEQLRAGSRGFRTLETPFLLRADTLKIDDRPRVPRLFSLSLRRVPADAATISYLGSFSSPCHFSRMPRFTIHASDVQSHTDVLSSSNGATFRNIFI